MRAALDSGDALGELRRGKSKPLRFHDKGRGLDAHDANVSAAGFDREFGLIDDAYTCKHSAAILCLLPNGDSIRLFASRGRARCCLVSRIPLALDGVFRSCPAIGGGPRNTDRVGVGEG